MKTEQNLYELAKNRVDDSEALAPHADFIGTSDGNDWGVGDEHWQWIATASESDILDWIEAGQ